MYCGHCAPCTAGIDIASVNKYYNLTLAQDEVPETVREHYSLLAHHASECIACGRCQSNCPFGVDIVGRMQLAAAKFGYWSAFRGRSGRKSGSGGGSGFRNRGKFLSLPIDTHRQ